MKYLITILISVFAIGSASAEINKSKLSDADKSWLLEHRIGKTNSFGFAYDNHGLDGNVFWIYANGQFYSTHIKFLKTKDQRSAWLDGIQANNANDIHSTIESVNNINDTIQELTKANVPTKIIEKIVNVEIEKLVEKEVIKNIYIDKEVVSLDAEILSNHEKVCFCDKDAGVQVDLWNNDSGFLIIEGSVSKGYSIHKTLTDAEITELSDAGLEDRITNGTNQSTVDITNVSRYVEGTEGDLSLYLDIGNTEIEVSVSGLTTDIVDAIQDAVEQAYDKGFDDGYAAGYADGFADGVASIQNN